MISKHGKLKFNNLNKSLKDWQTIGISNRIKKHEINTKFIQLVINYILPENNINSLKTRIFLINENQ